MGHFLIYEIIKKDAVHKKDICKKIDTDRFKKILAVLDIKKMIPIPDGVYHLIEFEQETDKGYRNLLEKEYRFCQKIQETILKRAWKVYETQKALGKPLPFYCNFSLLEEASLRYGALP